MSSRLHPQLDAMLSTLRAQRGFDAATYRDAKSRLLNEYMRRSRLKAVAVGISGGVDSAAVAGMVMHARSQPDSPIERVVGVMLPYLTSVGTTNQDIATERGREVIAAFGMEEILVDLSAAHSVMKASVDTAAGIQGGEWASGQLVSYLRTPAFFYVTSLLTQAGYPAIFIGTTNRDEGGYIGFFGKAGDAMVDLQLISDAHKSEVYAVSRLLGVPKSVLDAVPTGDIFDGRTDEQLIGVNYDFIELFQLWLALESEEQQNALVSMLGTEARAQFDRLAGRLRTLNRENSHKYLGGSPAVHLDVYERAVPGGWRADEVESDKPIVRTNFVNEFDLSAGFVNRLGTPLSADKPRPVTRTDLEGFGDSAFVLHDLLSADECAALLADLYRQPWVPVGRNGLLRDFDQRNDPVGSVRATAYSEEFAQRLWNRIKPVVPVVRVMDDDTPTDWNGDPVWRAIGINPLMRFIRYTSGGLLVPHYDAPYDYRAGKRTLMSFVLYLTDNGAADGGATRFIKDPQSSLPLSQRIYEDWHWGRLATKEDVRAVVRPQSGSALVFDHRLLHDSEELHGSTPKVIIRTDVVFERCGVPRKDRITVSRPLGITKEPLEAMGG